MATRAGSHTLWRPSAPTAAGCTSCTEQSTASHHMQVPYRCDALPHRSLAPAACNTCTVHGQCANTPTSTGMQPALGTASTALLAVLTVQACSVATNSLRTLGRVSSRHPTLTHHGFDAYCEGCTCDRKGGKRIEPGAGGDLFHKHGLRSASSATERTMDGVI